MIFPDSKLPLASQPWGREITKQLSNAIDKIDSERVNNAARDNQLSSSITAVQSAVAKAQVAADSAQSAATLAQTSANTANTALADIGAVKTNIYKPGTTQINPTSISSGTITGITINTNASLSSPRTELNQNNIKFYGADGIYVGGFTGSSKNGYKVIDVDTAGFNTAGPIWALGGFFSEAKAYLNAGVQVTGDAAIYGTLQPSIIDVANGGFYAGTSTVTSANIYGSTTSLAYNVHVQGSGNGYRLYRSTFSSSREIKENIRPLAFDTQSYLDISPVVFNYKDGILREEEKDWDIVGFIAEDFEDAGFGEHLIVQPQSEGEHIELRYDKMYMFLHKIVSEQRDTINELTARLEALENK